MAFEKETRAQQKCPDWNSLLCVLEVGFANMINLWLLERSFTYILTFARTSSESLMREHTLTHKRVSSIITSNVSISFKLFIAIYRLSQIQCHSSHKFGLKIPVSNNQINCIKFVRALGGLTHCHLNELCRETDWNSDGMNHRARVRALSFMYVCVCIAWAN